MKGLIFNVFQEAVEREHGQGAWDAVLEKSGTDGVFTSIGTYSDELLMKMVGAAAELLGTDIEGALRFAGRHGIPSMYQRQPQFFDDQPDLAALLRSLDDVIHVEVNKTHPGSHTPTFEVRDAAGGLDVVYRSGRHLPALAAGLIEGAGAHYGTPVDVAIEGPHQDGILLQVRFA